MKQHDENFVYRRARNLWFVLIFAVYFPLLDSAFNFNLSNETVFEIVVFLLVSVVVGWCETAMVVRDQERKEKLKNWRAKRRN